MATCVQRVQQIGTCAVLAAILATLVACAKKKQAPPLPPLQVSVATAEQRDVPLYGNWVGTLDGFVDAQIQPQAATGYLIKQDYQEGSAVRVGQVLFEIDPRSFQATLDQAEGQLVQAKAQLGLADIEVARDTPLVRVGATARSQLDNDVQQQAQSRGSVSSAEANVAQAKLNLSFTKVRSLINGVAGRALLQVGNLVTPSSTLTTVSQVNPIKVYFPISEQEYLALSKRAKVGGKADLVHSGNLVPLQLTLANGSVYPHSGHVVFVDRQVSPTTGSIQIAGSFPNPGNLLRPGQFGRVRAETELRPKAILIPQKAVSQLQASSQVAVVGSDNTVQIRTVTLGPLVGSDWIITSGIGPSERVVTEGISKLKNGMPVVPQPMSVARALPGKKGEGH